MENIVCYVDINERSKTVTGPYPAHARINVEWPGTTVYPFSSYTEAGEFAFSKRADFAGIPQEKRRYWAFGKGVSAFTAEELESLVAQLELRGYRIQQLTSVDEPHELRVLCGRSFHEIPGSWGANDYRHFLTKSGDLNLRLRGGDVVRESLGTLGMYEFYHVAAAPHK